MQDLQYKKYVHMYEKAKMIPTETILGMGVRNDKGERWRG
jgi:hypothetical protein